MTTAANLDKIPQGGELNVFRVFEERLVNSRTLFR